MTTRSIGAVVFSAEACKYGPYAALLSLPPNYRILGFREHNGNLAVDFLYWSAETRVVQSPNRTMFVPHEQLALLLWTSPHKYTGTLGPFLQTVMCGGQTIHIFDQTNYSGSGEVK